MRRQTILTHNTPSTKDLPTAELIISRREMKVLRYLLLLSAGLLLVGVTSPMLTLSKFILIKNTFSVASGVLELLEQGHFLLFLLIAGFSLGLPCFKLYVLFRMLTFALNGRPSTDKQQLYKYLHLMHAYGRWAMLDVMVVAVLIMTVKLGAVASIEIHAGLYIFALAVLLIMLITQRVVRLDEFR